MTKFLIPLASIFLCAAPAFASVCPSTANTNSDCGFLITINSTGMASVTDVTGATAFNSSITFVDGTSDPGNDGSLVGVVNNYSEPLSSFTLEGTGANAGIFDFSFNGICAYTSAAYCTSAQSGYEGPTTTFTNLQSTILFETTEGTVNFNPTLGTGDSTYFSIEDNPADIGANGGLTVSNVDFAASPEPSEWALISLGLSLVVLGRKFKPATSPQSLQSKSE